MAQIANDEEGKTSSFAASAFTQWASRAAELSRDEVQREIAAELAAGRPVYVAGVGDAAGKLFQLLPDGRRFEVCVKEDGSIEIMGSAAG